MNSERIYAIYREYAKEKIILKNNSNTKFNNSDTEKIEFKYKINGFKYICWFD